MSATASRWLRGLIGFLIAAIGFGCLNYTNGFDIDHHTAWAREHSFPLPSPTIYFTGAALAALGSLLFGHALASRRSQ